MTSAQNPELPNARPGRAAVIAAIHAFAEWLGEHPEVPAPTYLTATHTTYAHDELDERTRMAAVIDWANANDAQLMETESAVHARLCVLAESVHGVGVTYDRLAFKDESRKRYVAGGADRG
jgi:hypothetical protein